MFKIIVVDDDKELNHAVCTFLTGCGYEAVGASGAAEAYDKMYGDVFDLVVSDIMMPEVDGFEFAENVRAVNAEIPILFLTARDDLTAKQRGFKAGIDDYLTKPFEFEELQMRIGALLRRAKIASSRKIEIGNLVMDADEHTVVVDGEEIALTTREYNLLFKLLSYPKKTFTRTQLMDEFWGMESSSGLRTVDVYMTKLRDKMSGCTGFELVTVRGLGYKAVLK